MRAREAIRGMRAEHGTEEATPQVRMLVMERRDVGPSK